MALATRGKGTKDQKTFWRTKDTAVFKLAGDRAGDEGLLGESEI